MGICLVLKILFIFYLNIIIFFGFKESKFIIE